MNKSLFKQLHWSVHNATGTQIEIQQWSLMQGSIYIITCLANIEHDCKITNNYSSERAMTYLSESVAGITWRSDMVQGCNRGWSGWLCTPLPGKCIPAEALFYISTSWSSAVFVFFPLPVRTHRGHLICVTQCTVFVHFVHLCTVSCFCSLLNCLNINLHYNNFVFCKSALASVIYSFISNTRQM